MKEKKKKLRVNPWCCVGNQADKQTGVNLFVTEEHCTAEGNQPVVVGDD